MSDMLTQKELDEIVGIFRGRLDGFTIAGRLSDYSRQAEVVAIPPPPHKGFSLATFFRNRATNPAICGYSALDVMTVIDAIEREYPANDSA